MGDTETDPLISSEERPDDDDNGNTTQPFQLGDASTPGPFGESHRMTTRNRPPEHGGTAETCFIEPESGPVITLDNLKIASANETLTQKIL